MGNGINKDTQQEVIEEGIVLTTHQAERWQGNEVISPGEKMLEAVDGNGIWERRRQVFEYYANGMTRGAISRKMGVCFSTILRDLKEWNKRSVEDFDVEARRNEILSRYDAIYQHLAKLYLETVNSQGSNREKLQTVDRMIRVLEVQARVCGVMNDTQFNFGPNAGAQQTVVQEVKIPDDPAERDELARRLRTVRELMPRTGS